MNVLGRKKMLAVTKDMILTEAYLRNNYKPDSIAILYYESVLEKHGVSKAKYDSSLVWYGEKSHRLDKIYEEIEKSLIENKLLFDTLYMDSVNMESIRFKPLESLWTGPHRLQLLKEHEIYFFDQQIQIAGIFSTNDTIEWSASVHPSELSDSIKVRLYLLIANGEGRFFSRIKAVSMPDSLNSALKYCFCLPDSLPINALASVYLSLHNSGKEVLLDKFYLGERRVGNDSIPNDENTPPATDIPDPEVVSEQLDQELE